MHGYHTHIYFENILVGLLNNIWRALNVILILSVFVSLKLK